MDNPTEREYDRRLLEHDVLDLAQRVHLGELTEGERRELRYRILVRESQLTRVRQVKSVPLPDVVRRHRRAMILGDPGPGKTTLLRYVALHFARAILDGNDRVTVLCSMDESRGAWGGGETYRPGRAPPANPRSRGSIRQCSKEER